MSSTLPPYSIKALHHSRNKEENGQEKTLDSSQQLSSMDDIIKNKLLIDTELRSSMTFKTEEEKNSKDGKKGANTVYITPFHLNTDPQFKSTLPYLMVNNIYAYNMIIMIIIKKE